MNDNPWIELPEGEELPVGQWEVYLNQAELGSRHAVAVIRPRPQPNTIGGYFPWDLDARVTHYRKLVAPL